MTLDFSRDDLDYREFYEAYPKGYVIEEIVTGDRIVILHRVLMPDFSEKGFYRNTTSGESFRQRQLTYWHDDFYMKNRPCPHHFRCKQIHEWERDRYNNGRTWRKMRLKFPTMTANPRDESVVNTIEHASIWDFYTHIGYDHRLRGSEAKRMEAVTAALLDGRRASDF